MFRRAFLIMLALFVAGPVAVAQARTADDVRITSTHALSAPTGSIVRLVYHVFGSSADLAGATLTTRQDPYLPAQGDAVIDGHAVSSTRLGSKDLVIQTEGLLGTGDGHTISFAARLSDHATSDTRSSITLSWQDQNGNAFVRTPANLFVVHPVHPDFAVSVTNGSIDYAHHSWTMASVVSGVVPYPVNARVSWSVTTGFRMTAPRFVSGTPVPCSVGPAHADCTVTGAQLQQGAKHIVFTVSGPVGHTGRVFARVVPSDGRPDARPANNAANEAVTIRGQADMIIGISPASGAVTAGRATTYTVKMHNHGPDGASVYGGLRVYFPSGRVQAVWSGSNVSPTSSTSATWNFYLPAGATATARAVVTAPDRGTSGGLYVGFESSAHDPGHCLDAGCGYSALRRLTVG